VGGGEIINLVGIKMTKYIIIDWDRKNDPVPGEDIHFYIEDG